jgi:hypothetical protein
MGSKMLIQAWLYNDNKGTKLATTDKSVMVGAKEEDWEQISLVIPVSVLKEWVEAYQEVEGEEDEGYD